MKFKIIKAIFSIRSFFLFFGYSFFLFNIFQCTQNISKNQSSTINKEKSILKLALKNPLDSFDPIMSTSETSGIILSMIHRKLYKSLYNGRIINDLVESEKIIQNAIYISIKKNKSLTERDVVFSLNRLKKSGKQQWILKDIKNIHLKKINQQLYVVFILNGINNSIKKIKLKWKAIVPLLSLPQCSIYSKENFFKKENSIRQNLFSQDGDFHILESNSERIKLLSINKQKVEFKIVKDNISKWFFFKKKMLDVFTASGIYKNFVSLDNKTYKDVVELNVLYGAIVSSNKESILAKKEFRRALNYMFNRKIVTKKVLIDSFEPADYPVPPLLFKKLKPMYSFKENFSYKVKKKETVVIYSPSDRHRQLLAMILKDILKKMNLNPLLKIFDMPTLIRFNNQRKPGIYLLKWIADYPHAENFLVPLFHSKNIGSSGNRAYFQNKRIDKMLDNLREKNNIEEIQNAIRKEAPWLFIGFAKKRIFIHKPWKINYPIIYTGWNNSIFNN